MSDELRPLCDRIGCNNEVDPSIPDDEEAYCDDCRPTMNQDGSCAADQVSQYDTWAEYELDRELDRINEARWEREGL